MTVLIGASVLLVAGSTIALLFGWANANESLIWTSIAASAGAGVALALAYLQARRRPPAEAPSAASATTPLPPREAVAPESPERAAPETARPELAAPAVARAPAPERKEPAPAAKKTPARTRPQTPSAARVTSKPRSAPKEPATEVIALPDSKKYHRPECRYAKSKGAERMTKAAARRRSYSACGICKP